MLFANGFSAQAPFELVSLIEIASDRRVFLNRPCNRPQQGSAWVLDPLQWDAKGDGSADLSVLLSGFKP